MPSWFEVDQEGLRKLIERRGKSCILAEPIQNAWDQNVSRVEISLERKRGGGSGMYEYRVVDDDPAGFWDISHAYTLFAESTKLKDPGKRGRFNVGEKFILSLCRSARIETTKGTVSFQRGGRRKTSDSGTQVGSVFCGVLELTDEEVGEFERYVEALIPPEDVVTVFNGEVVSRPEAVHSFEESLATLIAREDGVLRRSIRKTTVELFRVRDGEKSQIFEMGLPVVATGDEWHVNVQQKVPLNMERNNVTPHYLKTLRVAVLNEMHGEIEREAASDSWVREATSDERCSDEALDTMLTHRFGRDRVIQDPTDKEANYRAYANGFNVVTGGSLSGGEWKNVRRSENMQPSGRVFPTPRPGSGGEDPDLVISEEGWTRGMRRVAEFSKELARRVADIEIEVRMIRLRGKSRKFEALYGNRTLDYNVSCLGRAFFDEISDRHLRILIHELGHEFCGNHLDDEYHEALCRLAVGVASLALEEPGFFEEHGVQLSSVCELTVT